MTIELKIDTSALHRVQVRPDQKEKTKNKVTAPLIYILPYKDRLDGIGTIKLSNDCILAKDDGSESKVLTREIETINEISSAIYITLKGGQSFILPKDKISDIDAVTIRLKELAAWLNILYNIDDTRKWK